MTSGPVSGLEQSEDVPRSVSWWFSPLCVSVCFNEGDSEREDRTRTTACLRGRLGSCCDPPAERGLRPGDLGTEGTEGTAPGGRGGEGGGGSRCPRRFPRASPRGATREGLRVLAPSWWALSDRRSGTGVGGCFRSPSLVRAELPRTRSLVPARPVCMCGLEPSPGAGSPPTC